MKKRVNESEIEKAKSSSHSFAVGLVALLITLLCVIGYLFLYQRETLLKTFEKEVEEKQEETKEEQEPEAEENNKIEVNLNNPNVKEWYEIVKITNPYTCDDGTYTNKEKVEVKNLSTKCKYAIASNLYREKVQKKETILEISEEKIKDAYEKLYGTSTYEKQESIPYFPRNELKYNAEGYYFTEKDGEEIDSSIQKYEKMIKAEKEENTLSITTTVIYYEKVNKVLCKDETCENVIEKAKEETNYTKDYFDLYMDYHKKELHNYTYKFAMDEIGFYHYIGYERTSN